MSYGSYSDESEESNENVYSENKELKIREKCFGENILSSVRSEKPKKRRSRTKKPHSRNKESLMRKSPIPDVNTEYFASSEGEVSSCFNKRKEASQFKHKSIEESQKYDDFWKKEKEVDKGINNESCEEDIHVSVSFSSVCKSNCRIKKEKERILKKDLQKDENLTKNTTKENNELKNNKNSKEKSDQKSVSYKSSDSDTVSIDISTSDSSSNSINKEEESKNSNDEDKTKSIKTESEPNFNIEKEMQISADKPSECCLLL